MRTVPELKALAERLATAAAEGGANTAVVVAIADIDPKTGVSHYHVSYGGGLLVAAGLVEKAKAVVARHLESKDEPE